jgi:hypothetical protein
VTLLFIVPPGSSMFVFEDGVWTQEIDPSTTSRLLAFDLFEWPEEYGFALVEPGQPAPTVPDIVIRPTDDDPDPT